MLFSIRLLQIAFPELLSQPHLAAARSVVITAVLLTSQLVCREVKACDESQRYLRIRKKPRGCNYLACVSLMSCFQGCWGDMNAGIKELISLGFFFVCLLIFKFSKIISSCSKNLSASCQRMSQHQAFHLPEQRATFRSFFILISSNQMGLHSPRAEGQQDYSDQQ